MPTMSQAAELNKMVLVSQQKNINEPSLSRSGGGADQNGTHIPALTSQGSWQADAVQYSGYSFKIMLS